MTHSKTRLDYLNTEVVVRGDEEICRVSMIFIDGHPKVEIATDLADVRTHSLDWWHKYGQEKKED